MTTMTCAGDSFCRCRKCKPPLHCISPQFDRERVDQRRLPSNRLVIGSTGLAIVLFVLLILSAR